MLLYIDKSKDSTKILLELINKFSKVTGYKISIQKSAELVYTNNEPTEREIKKTIQFITASKRINYVGISQEDERPVQ